MKVSEFASNRAGASETDLQFGVEVEVENCTDPILGSDRGMWHVTDDGSLRNGGIEFVSQPWSWDLLKTQLPVLYRVIDKYNLESSVRTGIHVHVNCLDLELANVGGILATYCLLEPVLFRLCGEDREECIYCVPWYRADDEVDIAAEVISGNYSVARNSCKYSSLYMAPLCGFGTLEFRHAPTYKTEAELRLWLTIVRQLVLYGRTRTAEQVLEEFHDSETAEDFLRTVVGAWTPRVLSRCEMSVDDIIDKVDAVAIAERLVPCTYKVNWTPINIEVQGTGHVGYHRLRLSRLDAEPSMVARVINADPYPDDYDDDYDEPEEDY